MSFKFIYQWLRFIYVPLLNKFPRLNPHTTLIHEKPTYNVGGVCVNTSVKWRNHRFTKAFNKTWDTIEKLGVANRKKFYAGSEWKCRNAVWAAITAKKNKSGGGCFVECGVGFGMTSSVILNYMKTPKFYLIDSWGKDIAKDKDETYHRYATYEQAKRVFAKFKQAKLIHGVVPQILYKMDIKNVSYLHLDLNSWRADLSALEYFWDKLLIGAIVIVDDFGFFGFEKTRKHIENFVKKKHTDIMYTALGPGIIVKT